MKHVFKILILGDGGVGKTTLLHRFVEGEFIDTATMTIGVQVRAKELKISSDTCQILLWDVTGQERFRFMIEEYFKGALGALILFDITNMKSFVNIEKWMTLLGKFYDDLPVILVAAKYDLEEFSMVGDLYARKIQEKLGFDDYIKTSAKSGMNVEKPFKKIAKLILNSEANLFKSAT
ncbi:MAG: Rab family GTPase [Promethearchaeota archaeon]